MNIFLRSCSVAILFLLFFCQTSVAAPFAKIVEPPLSERWFGIYVNSERVGFYRQRIDKAGDGYQIEGNGTVRLKVMSFSKDATTRETYVVAKNLALRSFDVEQTINGASSRVSGKVNGNQINIKTVTNGSVTDKVLKFKGDVYPGSALNLYPLLRTFSVGSIYNIQAFDPEEIKLRDIQITVLGEDKTSQGVPALKLRNNLYPFVTNDIWIDAQGNTLEESIKDGLVITKAETPEAIAPFIAEWGGVKKEPVVKE